MGAMTTDSGAGPLPAYERLQPRETWAFFAGLSAIPRPSKKEERVRAWVKSEARARGFDIREDGIGNLAIRVPASPGHETAPVVVLQGHLDMVCEKNNDSTHDFDRDPIQLVVDRDRASGRTIVRARGTTLGADNGIGVALAWGAAVAADVVHGPLELLLTVDEEAGMGGANALKDDFVQGRILLNLDCEDVALYVGCAGGCDVTLRWPVQTRPLASEISLARVAVSGLRGGHSGVDIHENRGNAVRLLARVLLEDGVPSPQLVEIAGGGRRNALAREASALVAGGPDLASALTRAAERAEREWRAGTEPGCRISVEAPAVTPESGRAGGLRAMETADTTRILRALLALPHGVLAVNPEMPGLVQTSNNVASIALDSKTITVCCMTRGSSMAQLLDAVRQIRATGLLAQAEIQAGNAYPGWQPNLASPLLATCRRVHQEAFGAEARILSIHAGLECGIIGDRIPGMDMVSFGPEIKGAHSPDEHVFVDSVERTWGFLVHLLRALTHPST